MKEQMEPDKKDIRNFQAEFSESWRLRLKTQQMEVPFASISSMVKNAKITIGTVTAEQDHLKSPTKWRILNIIFSYRLQQKAQEIEESVEFKKWKAILWRMKTDLTPHKVNSRMAV